MGIRSIVRLRAKGRCEICGELIPRKDGRPDHSFHHRFMRRMGGVDSVSNLLYTCLPCHRRLHKDEMWAGAFGWISWVEPELTPVWIHNYLWVALRPDGSYEHLYPDDATEMISWVNAQEAVA